MHLVLGHPDDPCCAGVVARLEALRLPARMIDAPLEPPARLTWRLDAAGVTSSLYPNVPDTSIAGVLVRDIRSLEPDGWEAADHAYMQAEIRAATLSWLASLACPVINRPDAALWYRAGEPLFAWWSLLRRAGLILPDVLITNDIAEARAFRRQLAARGIDGAVYSPLTEGSPRYLLSNDNAWKRLETMQARTPVCLIEPHGAPMLACIVGKTVIWNGAPASDVIALAPALVRFAAAAGLDFVEIALAGIRRGIGVVSIETRPRLEHFCLPVRARICDALVALMAPELASATARTQVPS